MKKQTLFYFLPFLFFLLASIIFFTRIHSHSTTLFSPLVNKPAPSFQLPNLLNKKSMITDKWFRNHITLVNVWATWCTSCKEEHALLLRIKESTPIQFLGFNYKDDVITAQHWLEHYGNPYDLIAVDHEGNAAMDWGVYGTPETFIVDKNGIIRYKYSGPITESVWLKQLKPLINTLLGEQV